MAFVATRSGRSIWLYQRAGKALCDVHGAEQHVRTPVTPEPAPWAEQASPVATPPSPASFDLDLHTEPTAPLFSTDEPQSYGLFDAPGEITIRDHLGEHDRIEAVGTQLPPYREFRARSATVDLSSPSSVMQLVTRILDTEGPATGFRIHEVVTSVVARTRLTKLQARQLNSAISTGVTRGRLAEDNPLGEDGVRPRTYRLPHH